jgi:hypothetical protein
MCLGSVYVYGSAGNVWSRQSKILAADGAASDQFGKAVSVFGAVSMIGAALDDDKANNAGNTELVYFLLLLLLLLLLLFFRLCLCIL